MTMFPVISTGQESTSINYIQPVTDDFSTDGYLNEYARIDHQHPLSESLRAAIYSSPLYVKKSGDTMTGALTTTGVQISGNGFIGWPSWFASNIWMQDATWLRISSSVYLATGTLATDGQMALGTGGAGDATYKFRCIWNMWCQGVLRISSGSDVNGNIRFDSSNPYIYASSYMIIPGGAYFNSGPTYFAGKMNIRGGLGNDTAGVGAYFLQNQTGNTYSIQQIIVRDDGNGGTQQAGISFWCVANGSAPIWRNFGGFGADRLDALNNANTAYCPVNAGAFNVISSERVKKEIQEIDDNELLSKFGDIKTHYYRPKVPNLVLRPTKKFNKINALHGRKGTEALVAEPKFFTSEPHDCGIDACNGTADNPCNVIKSDTLRFGLIAEHIHAVAPEATTLDPTGEPESYAVDQIAAMAFGGVGALLRRIIQLETRVDNVEAA